jgi:hypothetical protein
MGRKKIQISRITDERNRQVILVMRDLRPRGLNYRYFTSSVFLSRDLPVKSDGKMIRGRLFLGETRIKRRLTISRFSIILFPTNRRNNFPIRNVTIGAARFPFCTGNDNFFFRVGHFQQAEVRRDEESLRVVSFVRLRDRPHHLQQQQ